MGSNPGVYPAPSYHCVETSWDKEEDAPGPRCGHSLTAFPATKSHGPRLILFGGVTSIEEAGASDDARFRLGGVTNSLHCYDVYSQKWSRIRPDGDPPSPRAAHVAAAVGPVLVIQGGIDPDEHPLDDLYVLDTTNHKFQWHRVLVQGRCPEPRYGHVMDLVAKRYLVLLGGCDGKKVRSSAWALDTAQKPYRWRKLHPEGDIPSARMYASGSARSDGVLFLCGGQDASGTPLADAYGLHMRRNGQWGWTPASGVAPSGRYQHAAVFVGARLHVTGGTLRVDRAIEGESAVAVLDTAAGVWLDRNGIVTSSSTSKAYADVDGSLELMVRCRHASASVGVKIYIYGGFTRDILLDDLLIADNSQSEFKISSPVLNSQRIPTLPSAKTNQASSSSHVHASSDKCPEIPASGDLSVDKKSIDKLVEGSTAEPEAVSAARQVAKAASTGLVEGTPVLDKCVHVPETSSDGSDTEADVRLHSRAVVVARKTVGTLDGLVWLLSLDQFVNESRRLSPMNGDLAYPTTGQNTPQGLHKKIISELLRPWNWTAPTDRRFFLDSCEVGELCDAAEQIFIQEPTVLQLKAPVKVFGDIHGQFGDLMRLFDEYGFPSTAGDLMYIDYLFLGDYVDRGQHSLETITLLLALKIEYPEKVHLIRGNHEAAGINALYGFRLECIKRMGENDGVRAWTRFNQLFNFLPLAALIEKKIICMHGGIGRSINSVEQIEKLERPITMDAGSIILKDLLWSDPTANDSIEGLRPSARGPGHITFGPDRVTDFCKKNKLQLIIRAHECVMDGFERFARGKLITLFSATNYCGKAKNAGAILVVGRELVVVPKLIHPLPPTTQSSDTSPGGGVDDTWMQELNIERPPTPTRGRPRPDLDSSCARLALDRKCNVESLRVSELS